MEKISWKGHGAMLAANVMWGLMAPVSKFVMAGGLVAPLVITDLRVGGAMVLFWIASFFQKKEYVSTKDMLKLFAASLLCIVFNQGSMMFGLSLTSPMDASIITTSMPLWIMLLSALILKEPITNKKVLGIAAGAGGALLLILSSHSATVQSGSNGTQIWGDLLVVLAQLSYASYIVLFKNFVSKYSMITIMKWMFTFAFICLLPFSGNQLMTTPWAALQPNQYWGLAFIVVCATFFCYMLIVVGQRALRPTVAGMYNYIQPIVASIVAIYWGMDTFSITKLLAMLLIFSGVYLVTASRARKEQTEQKV